MAIIIDSNDYILNMQNGMDIIEGIMTEAVMAKIQRDNKSYEELTEFAEIFQTRINRLVSIETLTESAPQVKLDVLDEWMFQLLHGEHANEVRQRVLKEGMEKSDVTYN